MKVCYILIFPLILMTACSDASQVGKLPSFSESTDSSQFTAMYMNEFPDSSQLNMPGHESSLWRSTRSSLLGDRRAAKRGDILTVVIEINDKAEFSNATNRDRSGSSSMSLPHLLGIPQSIDNRIIEGATMSNAAQTNGSSTFSGDGTVKRNEKLALRVAATVIEELPNGVVKIEGQQEIRVNLELRELLISGFVRTGDISRQNEITYDKIAGARISYGGRGLVSEFQKPKWGQNLMDKVLPF